MTGRMAWWLVLFLATELCAQVPAVPTTVQLPTVSVFSVQTTVWAPDRGAAFLGGTRTASDQRRVSGFGPAATRDVTSTRFARAASVHVTIIDHAALDRAVLAEAARMRGSSSAIRSDIDEQARWLTQHLGRADTLGQGPLSVAEARAAHAQQEAAQERQAGTYLAQGQRALAAGQAGAARVYLQMAPRSDSPRIAEEAKKTLQTIFDKTPSRAGR